MNRLNGEHATALTPKLPYLRELQSWCRRRQEEAPGIDFYDYLTESKFLGSHSQTYWVSHGFHGFVYVATDRLQRRHVDSKVDETLDLPKWRPILGKIYSTFMFDPYRRPYSYRNLHRKIDPFNGPREIWRAAYRRQLLPERCWQPSGRRLTTHALCRQWARERLQSVEQAFAENEADLQAQLDALHAREETLRRANQADSAREALQQCDALATQIAAEKAAFAASWPHLVTQCSMLKTALRQALRKLESAEFANIDLFLRMLSEQLSLRLAHQGLQAQERQVLAEATVRSAFTLLARSNGLANKPREIWPIAVTDSWRTIKDDTYCLITDNLRVSGEAFTFRPADVNPCLASLPTKRVELGPVVQHLAATLIRSVSQDISEEGLREAYHQLLLGEWYFDERTQRSFASTPEQLASKVVETPQARQVRNDEIRQRACAALAVEIPLQDPVIAQGVRQARCQQAAKMAAAPSFPLFSNVPWAISNLEAQQIRRRHFSTFAAIPAPNDSRVGNCNSAVFTFLEMAATADEMRTLRKPAIKPPTGWRGIGKSKLLQMPYPRVLT